MRFFKTKPINLWIQSTFVQSASNLTLIAEMTNKFVWPLPDGFPPGSTATIKLEVSPDPTFALNFLTKLPPDDCKDIAYHANFNFTEGCLVNNSLACKKGWQKEERHAGLTITKGKTFEITIACEITHFSVYVNGNHFSDFQHRVPLGVIKCLSVVPLVKATKMTSISVDKIKNVMWLLPNGFQTITIKGTPGGLNMSNKFDILFQTSSKCDKSTEIPLGMSVLFMEGRIQCGVYKGNEWKKRETRENLFFQVGEEFEIMITNRGVSFEVSVNGQVFNCGPPHDKINCLVIRGNVSVSSMIVNTEKIEPRGELN